MFVPAAKTKSAMTRNPGGQGGWQRKRVFFMSYLESGGTAMFLDYRGARRESQKRGNGGRSRGLGRIHAGRPSMIRAKYLPTSQTAQSPIVAHHEQRPRLPRSRALSQPLRL